VTIGPIELVEQVVDILDDLGVPYALGGSIAASFFGEPRATADVDLAVDLDQARGEELLGRVAPAFYVPAGAARDAIATSGSFNLISDEHPIKVDLFVLGPGVLDRHQIERRQLVVLPGSGREVWVTSPEDQVLRKLDWYRQSGQTSERQWRDVIGLLSVRGERMDVEYLRDVASDAGLSDLLERAFARRDD
jgi:hypothetical protein